MTPGEPDRSLGRFEVPAETLRKTQAEIDTEQFQSLSPILMPPQSGKIPSSREIASA
jgi:hypothetical protein